MRPGGIFLGLLVVVISLVGLFSAITANAKTRVEVNIFHPGAAWNISSLNSLESDLGINFTSAKWYMDWATNFDTTASNNFYNNGYVPEMTWEPSLSGVGVSYNDVVSGDYDAYLETTANTVKNLGYTIRISLAPEMNTDWTPWGIGKQGNNKTNHVAFWRHVVDIFNGEGATNVEWIWSPNVRPWNAATLYGSYSEIFPGSNYVDYMGLDGYNWGTSQGWSTWQSFSEVFLSSYNELVNVSSKKILIMEMASSELGGDKAEWMSDMFKQLDGGFSRIQGFTWFNINKETDWRITSSSSAKESFSNGYLGITNIINSQTGNEEQNATSSTNNSESTTKQPTQLKQEVNRMPISDNVEIEDDNTTKAVSPKIAGANFINNGIPQKNNVNIENDLGILTSLLLGGTMVTGLLFRRYRLIHALHFQPVKEFGHKLVDGIFHNNHRTPNRITHHRRTIR